MKTVTFSPFDVSQPERFNFATSAADNMPEPTLAQSANAMYERESVTGSYVLGSKTDKLFESTKEEFDNWYSGAWRAKDNLKEGSVLNHPDFDAKLSEIQNERELAQYEEKVSREIHNEAVLANTGLGTSLTLGVAVGLLDPVTLPLLAVPAIKGTVFSRLVKGAAFGGFDAGVREYALHQSQEMRTMEESLMNVGLTSLLAGTLGGVLGRGIDESVMSQSARGYDAHLMGEETLGDALSQNAAKDLREKYGVEPLVFNKEEYRINIGTDTVIDPAEMDNLIVINPEIRTKISEDMANARLAKEEGTITIDEYHAAQREHDYNLTMLRLEAMRIQDEKLVKIATAKGMSLITSNQTKLMLSNSPTARLFAMVGLEVPYKMKNFGLDEVGGHAVMTEQFVNSMDMMSLTRDAYFAGAKKWEKLRGHGMGKKLHTHIFGNRELDRNIKIAMTNGDFHPTDEIATEIAKELRKAQHVVNRELISSGLLDGDPVTGTVAEDIVDKSYFHRVFDYNKVYTNPDKMADDIVKGFKNQLMDDEELLNKMVKEENINIKKEAAKYREEYMAKVREADQVKVDAQYAVAKDKADAALEKRMAKIQETAESGKRYKTEKAKKDYIERETKKANEAYANRLKKARDDVSTRRRSLTGKRRKAVNAEMKKWQEARIEQRDKMLSDKLEETNIQFRERTDESLKEEAYHLVMSLIKHGRDENFLERDLMDMLTSDKYQMFATPAILRGRTLRVKTEDIADWTMDDVIGTLDVVARRGAGSAALKKKFGTVDPQRVKRAIEKDYDSLMVSGKLSNKEIVRLRDEMKVTLQRVDHVWNMLLGKNPDYSRLGSVEKNFFNTMRAYQMATKLGSSAISAVEDFAAMPLHLGLQPIFSSISSFLARGKIHNMTRNAMKDLRVATEAVVANTAAGRAGSELTRTSGQVSQVTHVLTNWFMKGTGMPFVDRITKEIVSYVLLSRMARSAVKNGKLSKVDAALLKKFGINDEMQKRIADQMKKKAYKPDKDNGYLANFDEWDDYKAMMEAKMAMSRASRQVISTPNIGNQPMWMQHAVGGTVGQFKSHMLGTMDNHLIPIVQMYASGDAAQKLNVGMYVVTGYMLTSLNYNLRSYLMGKEPDNSPARLSKEFITRTGGLGVWGTVLGITDSYMNIGAAVGLTDQPPTMFASRSVLDHIGGPFFGSVTDAFVSGGGIINAIANGEMTRSQIAAMRRLMPFQNHVLLRKAVSNIENRFVDYMAPR